jgi:hypothetical protein
LQQLEKQGRNSGFALWKELQETLTGEDCKVYNRKHLSKKLGDPWKTQLVSLLAYKGEMKEVIWLAKDAGENWDEASGNSNQPETRMHATKETRTNATEIISAMKSPFAPTISSADIQMPNVTTLAIQKE